MYLVVLRLLPMSVFPRQDHFSALNTAKMQPWILVGHSVFRSFSTFEKIPCHVPSRHCFQKVHCATAGTQTTLHRAGDTGFRAAKSCASGELPLTCWQQVGLLTNLYLASNKQDIYTHIYKYIYICIVWSNINAHLYTNRYTYTQTSICILFRSERLKPQVLRCCAYGCERTGMGGEHHLDNWDVAHLIFCEE